MFFYYYIFFSSLEYFRFNLWSLLCSDIQKTQWKVQEMKAGHKKGVS